MSSDKTFPMQQGYLDDLCSIYAVINLRHLFGLLDGIAEAGALFAKLLGDTAKDGNLFATLTSGISPTNGDIGWLLDKAGFVDVQHKTGVTTDWLAAALRSGLAGVLAFLRFEKGFTHHTVINRVIDENTVSVFDSYGLREVSIASDRTGITVSTPQITHAWICHPAK